ncbi:hypothetical protein TNCV_3226721 [Trichonephila clavipes]|nr:hypothetical protein TNCV_3226721 [Trichonephila clavipes]
MPSKEVELRTPWIIKQVIFSNQPGFNLNRKDNRLGVWMLHDERLNPAFAVKRYNTLTTGVIAWATWVATNGRTPRDNILPQKSFRGLPLPCFNPSLACSIPRFVTNRESLG